MAEAQKTVKVVKTETVTLTLSKDEAEALVAVVGNVTGHGSNSPRKHTDAIYRALVKQTRPVFSPGHPTELVGTGMFNDTNARIHFRDYAGK